MSYFVNTLDITVGRYRPTLKYFLEKSKKGNAHV